MGWRSLGDGGPDPRVSPHFVHRFLESPSDPEKKCVHDPLILGNDQPFFKGQKETPGSPKSWLVMLIPFSFRVRRRLQVFRHVLCFDFGLVGAWWETLVLVFCWFLFVFSVGPEALTW